MKKLKIFEKCKKFFKNISKKTKKFKNKFKGFFDEEDKKLLKPLALGVVLYGSLSNFVFWHFFGLPFTFYSWLAYGFAIVLIENKIIKWFRKLWFRK